MPPEGAPTLLEAFAKTIGISPQRHRDTEESPALAAKRRRRAQKMILGIIQSFLRLLRLFAAISARFDLLRASVPLW
jgi:hypothetical protein